MVKPKVKSKKAQKHGVDFKKIQRKIGRKLPPPKNATNTEIKSRAIVLPEQSVASEKAGLAVNKKGLTLKELLQQTSHHNAKVRKDALVGVKDILIKHPDELMLHKHFVIEKLRGRISDDDKSVRETLYQLFKSVIFPGCAKDNQGQSVSLMMTYIFIAMDSTIIDVRLMGFKFFDLVIQYYPSSLSLYAEKILQNYEDILQKNQFLEDKSKLKSILDGLVHCLSLLPLNEREDYVTTEKETPAHDILHAFEPEVARKPIGLTDIAKKSKDLLPILVGLFLDIMPVVHTPQLDAQSCSCMQFILQSIDLIVKFSLCWISASEQDPQVFSLSPKPDVTTHYPSLSLVILKKLWDIFPLNIGHQFGGKVDDRIFMLNTVITKIFLQLSNWNYSSSDLLEKFLEFMETSLCIEIESGKMSLGKHLLPLVPFIPKLAMGIAGSWRFRLLQVFTKAFKTCNHESSMKLACLSAIEEMLAPEKSWIYLDADDSALLDYQIEWMKELPSLLVSLDHKNPLCSKAVLRLQLRMGKAASIDSQFSREFDSTQYHFSKFFSKQNDQDICNGPFIKLPPDVQELAICCLYYFSFMDSKILQPLILCCLCKDLEPYMVFRILEVMQSAFRAGHIKVEDYTSFHVTLLSQFRVYPENWLDTETYEKSNWKTFKLVTSIVCTCLSEIGEDYLVLKMLEKIIVDQICSEIPVDNKCAFLRLLVTLDSKPAQLSDQSVVNMSHVFPQYLIDIAPKDHEFDDRNSSDITVKRSAERRAKRRQYYLIPSFCLFHRCKRLLNLVLNEMGTLVSDVSSAIGSHHPRLTYDRSTSLLAMSNVLRLICEDVRIRQTLLSCNTEIETLLHKLLNILSAEGTDLSLDERHEIRSAYDQLRTIASNEVASHP